MKWHIYIYVNDSGGHFASKRGKHMACLWLVCRFLWDSKSVQSSMNVFVHMYMSSFFIVGPAEIAHVYPNGIVMADFRGRLISTRCDADIGLLSTNWYPYGTNLHDNSKSN